MLVLAAPMIYQQYKSHTFSYHTAVVAKPSNIIYFHHDFEITVNSSIAARIFLIIVRIKNYVLFYVTNFLKF